MNSTIRRFAPLLTLALLGCGGAERPVPITPSPAIAAIPLDSLPPAVGRVARAPEAVPLDRWREPFAVAGRSQSITREPRRVVVRGSPPPLARVDSVRPAVDPVRETATPRAQSASGPSTATGQRARTYEVERGDTWFGLARRFGVSPGALGAANPGVDPERIQAGQTLTIPAPEATAPARRTHQVRPGDTLWGIARQYDVTLDQIRAANELRGDAVRAGQTLVIPGSGG